MGSRLIQAALRAASGNKYRMEMGAGADGILVRSLSSGALMFINGRPLLSARLTCGDNVQMGDDNVQMGDVLWRFENWQAPVDVATDDFRIAPPVEPHSRWVAPSRTGWGNCGAGSATASAAA
ncbi:hypothetical protein DYH09_29690 [bacterium CPR1]|nr:hypothetical protein [bacterium CPR1]